MHNRRFASITFGEQTVRQVCQARVFVLGDHSARRYHDRLSSISWAAVISLATEPGGLRAREKRIE